LIDWSTISVEVLLPPEKPPPCTQIARGLLVSVSPCGR
jgi:hypothetical protein